MPSAKADSGLAIAISRHFRAGLLHSAATRLVPALFQYALFHSARSILSSITGVDLLPTVLTTIRARASLLFQHASYNLSFRGIFLRLTRNS